jgi:dTDP-4-amino-4,6-dideoxygalactose transaminase
MNNKIWLSTPHMGGEEIKFINEAFKSNWIAPLGPNVDGMEQDICNFTGSNHSAVLSSGTAAIHLGLILLGIKPGDEVLCSTFTFSASCNPILYLGAKPVFIDSEFDTWNMSPELLEQAIINRLANAKLPKAIILVHLYGMPAQMDKIIHLSQKYNIPIIEDAAEALGSTYYGKNVGTFGQIGVLSFNGNKIITTSGGGALLSNDEKLVKKARYLATQARDEAPHYQHSEIGYNYRMSNIAAGIGRGQMIVLPQRVKKRREIYDLYRKAFSSKSQIAFLNEPIDFFSNRWLSCILFDNFTTREKIRLKLAKANIESRPLWKPMHLQPIFEKYKVFLNGVSDQLFQRGLCLPSGSSLSCYEIAKVIDVIKVSI